MNWTRTLVIVAIHAAPSASLACKATRDETAPRASAEVASAAAPTSTSSASGGIRPARQGRPRGPTAMLFAASHDLDLDGAHRDAIAKLEASLARGDGARLRDEYAAARADIVLGIRTGNVDAQKMAAHDAVIDAISKARRDADHAAVNGLHAALDASQRKALVVAVEARRAALRDEYLRAHDAATPEAALAGLAGTGEKVVETLATRLSLDAAQRAKLAKLFAPTKDAPSAMAGDLRDTRRLADARLAAFERDDFDATKFDPDVHLDAHGSLADPITLLSQAIVPMLRAEQREKLASFLAERYAVAAPAASREHASPQGD